MFTKTTKSHKYLKVFFTPLDSRHHEVFLEIFFDLNLAGWNRPILLSVRTGNTGYRGIQTGNGW
jgi:hypothetical protein